MARRYSGTYVIPARLVAAPDDGPLRSGRDQRYLEANFGTTSPQGATTLADALGTGWLGGRGDDDRLDAALGTAGAGATAPLPKVDLFTLWNEPNHQGFLRPQWTRRGRGFVPRSPHLYRDLVQRAYPAIKGVRPDASVLIGGTSFTGAYSGRGTGGVPPLRFLRELACVGRRFKPLRRSGCGAFAPGARRRLGAPPVHDADAAERALVAAAGATTSRSPSCRSWRARSRS